MTLTVWIETLTLLQTQHDYHELMKLLRFKLNTMKYTANFPVTINNTITNATSHLFNTGATIS